MGQKIIKLIKHGIAFFAAHTTLDVVEGGLNDFLFEILALSNKEALMPIPHINRCASIADKSNIVLSIGRVGDLIAPMKTRDLIAVIKKRLNLEAVNYAGDIEKSINRIGICTGSAGIDYIVTAVQKGCDALICGDLKHHNAVTAEEMGLVVIDGTHYATEISATDILYAKIKEAAEIENMDLEIFKSNRQKPSLRQG
jgi:dinuclear metal center YbgI/SA1388 family protein